LQGNESEFLPVTEAARKLGIDRVTLFRWIKKGYLAAKTLPSGRHRIPVDEVERLLHEGRPSIASGSSTGPYRIVIIDDEKGMLDLMSEMVELCGLDVSVKAVQDGLSALIDIGAFNPDLIIIDYYLPDIDGLKIIEKIKENTRIGDIPIILVSGMLTLDEDAIKRHNITAFLKKPFQPDDLTSLIKQNLGQK